MAWVLGLLVGPFGGVLLLVERAWPPLVRLDVGVRDGLHRWVVHAPHVVLALKVVSRLGEDKVELWGVLVLVVALAGRRRPRAAVFVVLATVGGSLLNHTVKGLVDRPRPVLPDPVAHAGSSSFPSGHGQAVAVLVGVLLVLALPVLRRARPYAVAVGVLWAALMGFSRVALGVHWVSDVVAGYALGAAWVLALTALLRPAGGTVRAVEPSGAGQR